MGTRLWALTPPRNRVAVLGYFMYTKYKNSIRISRLLNQTNINNNILCTYYLLDIIMRRMWNNDHVIYMYYISIISSPGTGQYYNSIIYKIIRIMV